LQNFELFRVKFRSLILSEAWPKIGMTL
jgi:hypothetical protein